MKRILLTVAIATVSIGGYAFAQTHSTPGRHESAAEASAADQTDEAEGADQTDLAAQATISPAQARSIALAARAGEVKDHELEQEPGGSGLRYSFDILAAGKTWEVGVDARTGVVLENSEEGPNPD